MVPFVLGRSSQVASKLRKVNRLRSLSDNRSHSGEDTCRGLKPAWRSADRTEAREPEGPPVSTEAWSSSRSPSRLQNDTLRAGCLWPEPDCGLEGRRDERGCRIRRCDLSPCLPPPGPHWPDPSAARSVWWRGRAGPVFPGCPCLLSTCVVLTPSAEIKSASANLSSVSTLAVPIADGPSLPHRSHR